MTVISTKSIMFFAALVVSVAMLSTVIDFNWPREVVTTEDPTPTPRPVDETPLHTSPVFLPGTQPRDLKSPPTSARGMPGLPRWIRRLLALRHLAREHDELCSSGPSIFGVERYF
ncbi:hypothetical protein BMS3Abin16_00498 [archaeon BMS3Abin16]|nr:hypothetical protein BMS3Abin16_00498 [archaeon BMS3Abin16]